MFPKIQWSLPLCLLNLASLAQCYATSHTLVKHNVATNSTTTPQNFGVVVFRAFLLQDMVAVVDPLQLLAHNFHMNLYILAETLDAVTTEPGSAATNGFNSSFWPQIVPTHTFAEAPDDIEVLIVPGGPGVRAADVSPVTDFIRETYPKLKYLITVCTGAGLAAKAGVLDGRRATTNKASWATITAMGPNTTWVSPARWVVDGNIWTSSGVTAGLDLVFAWISEVWGPEWADRIESMEEYVPHAQDFDPFAAKYNVTPSG
ncbi:DJ-1/PfpI family protein [Biscogniauxia mediterranea]|nr:DJ-1/PfpI family protein [Biscogniauxia mediterranea]